MKVKLTTVMAGPQGTYQPGQTVDVDDETGKVLIRMHGARPLCDKAVKYATNAKRERATLIERAEAVDPKDEVEKKAEEKKTEVKAPATKQAEVKQVKEDKEKPAKPAEKKAGK